jgi:hypothetical protein
MSDDRRPSARRLGLYQPRDAEPVRSPVLEAPPMTPVYVPTYQVYRGQTWPAVLGRPSRRVLVAVGAVGAVAAIMLPTVTPGLGWLVTVLAAVTGVGWAAWQRFAPQGRDWWLARWERAGWALLAVLLAAVCVLRSAGWLDTLALLGSVVAATLAVTGGRRLSELAFALIAVPVAGLRGLPWLGRGMRMVRHTEQRTARLLAAALVGVLLLVVFGALLAGADAGFGRLLWDLTPRLDIGSVLWAVFVFAVAVTSAVGACYLLVSRPAWESGQTSARLRRAEWALPVGALVVLFAAFVGVQVVAMFGGSGYVLVTPGLTYAQYARGGFWELLVVAVLTLLVIWGAVRFADRDRDRAWLRVLLGLLAVLSVLIVTSALVRMWSYQQAYGFTVLRLLVEACEVWLGVVYLLIIVAGVRMRAGWLPRGAVALGMVALLVLAGLNPDGFIAAKNIERFQATGHLDSRYLAGLSPDAIDAVRALPEPAQGCVLVGIARELGPEDWRSWNVSRAEARAELAGHGPACGE